MAAVRKNGPPRRVLARTVRITPGGIVFPVLNRGMGRQLLCGKPDDFEAFEEIVAETLDKYSMRICVTSP